MKHAENQKEELVSSAKLVKKTKIKLDKFLRHFNDGRPFQVKDHVLRWGLKQMILQQLIVKNKPMKKIGQESFFFLTLDL